ncbi:MAG: glucose-6-phosphate isomerase family protein, partial [Chloroflexota bacterium]
MPTGWDTLGQRFDPLLGGITGAPSIERRLRDLRGAFADAAAYEAALAQGDPLIYSVASVEAGSGPGDLHYGVGTLMPGRIGAEYYLTKGHLHAWRPAAEVYIGIRGEGALLLEDEQTGESRLVPLGPHQVVYVPGSTAHRTVNTGDEPLVYLGIYPAAAGHDYAAIAERNFRCVVIA